MPKLSEIPNLDAPGTGARRRRRAAVRITRTRREAMATFGLAATAASLAIFGRQRIASASHVGADGYQIEGLVGGSCYQTGFYTNNSSCNLCGPSPSYSSGCLSSGHYAGYHSATWPKYRLRKDDCHYISSSLDYDGWLWRGPSSTCCYSCRGGSYDCKLTKSTTVRCHDGRVCNSSGGSCVSSICEYRTSGSTSGCPS